MNIIEFLTSYRRNQERGNKLTKRRINLYQQSLTRLLNKPLVIHGYTTSTIWKARQRK